MIEFSGEQSVECKTLIAKEKSKRIGLISSLTTLFISIIVLAVGIVNNKLIISFVIIATFVFLSILAFVVPQKRINSVKINSKILVNSDHLILHHSTNFYTCNHPIVKNFSKIKSVIDYGICFCIIFKYGDITNAWVCEKRLIAKGSIEEFEKIFENKIIKKC